VILLHDRIKQVRKALELTQREFGERIGLKANSVTLIEKGRNTSDQTVFAICREFGVNEKWLRTGEGEMFNPAPADHLEILVRERHLTHNDYVLMEKFINLKPEGRQAVMDYITEVVKEMNSPESRKFPSNAEVAAAMAPVGNSDKFPPEVTAQLAALQRENEELKKENAELKERERQAILHERDTLKEIIAQDDAKPFGLSPTIPVFSSKNEL